MAAIALGHEVATTTAVGNDAGYEKVFSAHRWKPSAAPKTYS